MTSRLHSLLPKIAIAVALAVVPAVVLGLRWWLRTYEVPDDEGDVFAVAEGVWAWTTGGDTACATDAHTISFTPDRRRMIIASARPFEGMDGVFDSITTYDIHEYTRSRIRGAIPGESRLTDEGVPVVWDLVLRTRDRYAWHRTDWPEGSFTADIRRCVSAR